MADRVLRIVALDLPSTDIATFAGVDLVGAAVASQYRAGRSDFVLRDDVIDIGTTSEPNLELLQALKPDLLVSAWPVHPPSVLSEIAPVLNLAVFKADGDRYDLFAEAVHAVATQARTTEIAARSLAKAEAALNALAEQLKQSRDYPVYLASLNNDGIHLRALGPHSLCGAILRRLNIENAFTENDGIWGWRLIRPEELLAHPDTRVIEITQHWDGPALARRRLVESPIWQSLPQVQTGRVTTLPPIALLGGLSSGIRFASLLTASMMEAEP